MENDDSSLYLNEIAQRLWSDHASLMVGAGFSKNAIPIHETLKKFSDGKELGDVLKELGDVFYQELHKDNPNDSKRTDYALF
jgi:hypothetical protein